MCRQVNNPDVAIVADFFHMSIGYGHTDFAAGFDALRRIGYQEYMALECGAPGPGEIELPKSAEYMKQWL